MKPYSGIISLVRNGRGVYCLDTTMGCTSGMSATDRGCYGDCYAARTAKRYGHDFSKTILRNFRDGQHIRSIVSEIGNLKMPFVRIGCSGDPSENWEHTVKICKIISYANKEIIIITRHWQTLTKQQLLEFTKMNICINTSVSALDRPEIMQHCLTQYKRVKPFCKSVLRIVSCDFNLHNETGKQLHKIQERLFENESTLDTVFRPSKNNKFVMDGIINVKKAGFNGSKQLMSKRNKKTYTGKCSACLEMCGVNILSNHSYPNKRGIVEQLSFFNPLPKTPFPVSDKT